MYLHIYLEVLFVFLIGCMVYFHAYIKILQ
jgi:hypothetical protein